VRRAGDQVVRGLPAGHCGQGRRTPSGDPARRSRRAGALPRPLRRPTSPSHRGAQGARPRRPRSPTRRRATNRPHQVDHLGCRAHAAGVGARANQGDVGPSAWWRPGDPDGEAGCGTRYGRRGRPAHAGLHEGFGRPVGRCSATQRRRADPASSMRGGRRGGRRRHRHDGCHRQRIRPCPANIWGAGARGPCDCTRLTCFDATDMSPRDQTEMNNSRQVCEIGGTGG